MNPDPIRRWRSWLPALCVALLSGAGLAAQGRTWRVAPSGGDFTEVQPAFDTAAPGDVIVVTPFAGTYAGFLAYGKGVTICSLGGGQPQFPKSDLGQVPQGQSLVLSGLRFQGRDFNRLTGAGDVYTLGIGAQMHHGTVLVSGCWIETGRGEYYSGITPPWLPRWAVSVSVQPPATGIVMLEDCDIHAHDEAAGVSVAAPVLVLSRCRIFGGEAYGCCPLGCIRAAHGGKGVVVVGLRPTDRFYLSECEIRGGDVLVDPCVQWGGYGLGTIDATVHVFARTTHITGGNAGRLAGSEGGAGLRNLLASNSVVYLDGNPFVGGNGPIPGLPVADITPIPWLLAGAAVVPVPAGRGLPATLSLSARPAEPHLVLLSEGLVDVRVPGLPEPILALPPIWFGLGLFVMDAQGQSQTSFTVPQDPALVGRALFFQSVGLTPSQLVIGPATGTVVR